MKDSSISEQLVTRKPIFTGEPFERFVAILIALVTIIAAVAGFLQADASGKSAAAQRDAQRFALQAMGEKSRGEVQAGYAWTDAYRLWLEMDSLAFSAKQGGETEIAREYEAVRDRLAQVNPLLSPPYFNPSSGAFPDINAYEADLYLIDSTSLVEHFANSATISDEWDNKSSAYVSHLTLLTVALFLLGLSVTIVGRARWMFVAMGTVIAGIAVVWMAITAVKPVGSVPEPAMDAYAHGVGLAFEEKYDQAVQAFDEAITHAPGYANAYYERAKAAAKAGSLDRAAADYEASIQAGREDVWALWNLGWTYYLLGRFDDAMTATEAALEQAPDQVGLRFNLALAYLARGNGDAATAAYADGMKMATDQVAAAQAAGKEAPVSLWWYLNASGVDLDHLLDCANKGVCKGSPPAGRMANVKSANDAASAIRQELKSLAVALENTGLPPGPAVAAAIADVAFVEPVYDDAGAIASYRPFDPSAARLRGAGVFEQPGEAANLAVSRRTGLAEDLFVSFDYNGLEDGQTFVVKVYVNGQEAPGLRMNEAWRLGPKGTAVLPLTPGSAYELNPGEYRVEIYVNSHLLQEGAFTIQ